MKVIVKKNKHQEILIKDNSSIDFVVEDNASLTLKFCFLRTMKNVDITGVLRKNAKLKTVVADFSKGQAKMNAKIYLNEEGANARWDLASLTTSNDQKEFNISFIHNKRNTIADMNNYGVALNSSRLVFSGINHIKKNAKKCNTNQNAKIIVFDSKASGKANPILKIDDNDVLASHAAIVGRLNDEHLFYLKSRGLDENEAKALIIRGYLMPIASYFMDNIKNQINSAIMEKCHV